MELGTKFWTITIGLLIGFFGNIFLGRRVQQLRRKYLMAKIKRKYGKMTWEEFQLAIPRFNQDVYDLLWKTKGADIDRS